MADELTAFDKVEDAIAAAFMPALAIGQPLEGFAILTDWPEDDAIEVEKAVVIGTPTAIPEQAEELNQTFWRQTVQIEVIDGPQVPGMISRGAKSKMAAMHTLLAADRTLGGRLQDLQEIDIAGTQAEGKDVHGASVQYRAELYTPRDDWFTIVGLGGATF